ncbi:MAG: CYTH domain-containing protein [Pseudomonadales bacterium]|nr:CYTH domain-containing protein [Pseudomonadales bacterium]
MALEIERKFLVKNDSWKAGLKPTIFKQAYLNSEPDRTVRVRIAGEEAFLTIKSKTTGISRQEFEYAIPVHEAEQLLKLCETPALEKNRYFLKAGDLTWEIDEFLGLNAGLVVAEIELDSEQQSFDQPAWLGKEVSDDKRYFNSALSLRPFSEWE